MFTTRSRAVALATLTSLALLAGCGSSSNDNKPDAPTGFTLTPGDGRIYVTWKDDSSSTDLRYWLFSAQTTTMTRDDYRKYPDARITAPVTTGFALTGLTNGLDYAMFMNATHGNGPGGAETETKTARPRLAGDNWAEAVTVREGRNGAINDITTFLTYYIAVGADGAIVYSTDPRKSWTAATVVGAAPTAALNGVASNTTMAVAVGDNGSVYYTTDAVKWTAGAVTWASGTTGAAVKLNKVAMAPDSAFVAVGDNGVIVRTTDGINWTELTAGQKPTSLVANLNAIRNLNGTAVIVGDNGTLLKSATTSDLSAAGVNISTGTSKNLRALLYYGGYYFAAGSEGELIISTDLTTWHHQSAFDTMKTTINGLALGSRLLAVGNDGTIRIGVFSSSSATDAFFKWSAPVPSEAGNVSPTGSLLSVSGTSAGFVATTLDGKTVSAF